jgi:hypothetical protein
VRLTKFHHPLAKHGEVIWLQAAIPANQSVGVQPPHSSLSNIWSATALFFMNHRHQGRLRQRQGSEQVPPRAGSRISKALVQTHQTRRHGPFKLNICFMNLYVILLTLITMLHVIIDDTKDKPVNGLPRKIMF